MSARPKLTVAVPFPVHPPVGGGQQRVFALYRHVAREFDVELVTIAGSDAEFFEGEISPGLREIRIPKTPTQQAEETRLEREVGGIPVGDIGIRLFGTDTPEYARRLTRSMETADLVVASHPYAVAAAPPDVLGGHRIVYEAHNVEYLLKKEVFRGAGATGDRLVETVRALEAEVCRAGHLVFCCSVKDGEELCRLYGVDPARVVVAPNGVDVDAIPFTSPAARQAVKVEFGLGGQAMALFVGSWHPPNLDAADLVFDIARATPAVNFVLAGSQCRPLANRTRPTNVGLMGVVDDETLGALLALADVALNPMVGGSGTNLKLATYLAAGVPVITTPIGARGYALVDGDTAVICPAEEFPDQIRRLLNDGALAARLARRGRELVVTCHDWKAIASEMVSGMRSLLDQPASSEADDPFLGAVCTAVTEVAAFATTALTRQVAVAIAELGFDDGSVRSGQRSGSDSRRAP